MSSEQPLISIVIIAKSESEINNWKEKISSQTYSNYEIITSTEDSIPKAWNDAISQASGDIFLFTETDTEPIHDDWLETIVEDFDTNSDQVVHFGEFRGYGTFNFSNLAMDPNLIERYSIDETFSVGEDSEWFARMDRDGVSFNQRPTAPVYHQPRPLKKEVSRSFAYGLANARCIYRHGRLGPSSNTNNTTVEVKSDISDWLQLFTDRAKQVALKVYGTTLYWLGLFIGLLVYFPTVVANRILR